MKKFRNKSIILVVLGLFFLIFESLNFTGFCYAQKRFFNADQLLYRMAARDWIKTHPNASDEEIEKIAREQGNLYRYSVSSFTPFNTPGLSNGFFTTFFNRLFGRYFYYVSAFGETDDRYKMPDIYGSESMYYVDACGIQYIHDYGESFTKEEYFREMAERKKWRHKVDK